MGSFLFPQVDLASDGGGDEGGAAFLHLAVHPGISLDPKEPACTPLHVRALMDALLPYGFLVRLARAVENEQRVNIDEEMLDTALDNMIDCGELASPQMVEMEERLSFGVISRMRIR